MHFYLETKCQSSQIFSLQSLFLLIVRIKISIYNESAKALQFYQWVQLFLQFISAAQVKKFEKRETGVYVRWWKYKDVNIISGIINDL